MDWKGGEKNPEEAVEGMEEMREESCSIQVAVDDGRQVAEMCFL